MLRNSELEAADRCFREARPTSLLIWAPLSRAMSHTSPQDDNHSEKSVDCNEPPPATHAAPRFTFTSDIASLQFLTTEYIDNQRIAHPVVNDARKRSIRDSRGSEQLRVNLFVHTLPVDSQVVNSSGSRFIPHNMT